MNINICDQESKPLPLATRNVLSTTELPKATKGKFNIDIKVTVCHCLYRRQKVAMRAMGNGDTPPCSVAISARNAEHNDTFTKMICANRASK